jgi:hypothetical protein
MSLDRKILASSIDSMTHKRLPIRKCYHRKVLLRRICGNNSVELASAPASDDESLCFALEIGVGLIEFWRGPRAAPAEGRSRAARASTLQAAPASPVRLAASFISAVGRGVWNCARTCGAKEGVMAITGLNPGIAPAMTASANIIFSKSTILAIRLSRRHADFASRGELRGSQDKRRVGEFVRKAQAEDFFYLNRL